MILGEKRKRGGAATSGGVIENGLGKGIIMNITNKKKIFGGFFREGEG